MIPPAPSANPARSRRRLWFVLLLGVGLLLALPVAGLTRYLRLSRDTRTLRDGLLRAGPAQWDKTIELNMGALTLTLARAVLDRIEVDLEPEVRAALQALRKAEVGIYQRRGRHSRLDVSTLLARADQAMASRGWDRLVGVVERQHLVGIYIPKTTRLTHELSICLLVVDDRQAVVASARGDLEPLVDMALHRPEWPRRPAMPSNPAAQVSLASHPPRR